MMEAAVDYKQYGNLDAMKDIIDARGNDKLTKKIPRNAFLKLFIVFSLYIKCYKTICYYNI